MAFSLGASLLSGLGTALSGTALGSLGSAISSAQSAKNNTLTNAGNVLTSPVSSSAQQSFGDSWGGGNSWGFQDMSSYGYSDSQEDSWSTTYGREASAEDINRADEANKIAFEMWKAQAKYNAEEAELNRQFQAYMSNTAYQRAVEDLRKAGLNPILAAASIGGATTPGGSVATSGLASSHKATTYPQQESESHGWSRSESGSESHSQSGSSEGYGSHNESTSKSNSGPLLEKLADANKITAKAVADYIQAPSGKRNYDNNSWKSFDDSGYDPAY